MMIAVVDGLGHGAEAATAARTAIDALALYPDEPIMSLLRVCHAELKRTRGVVMSLADINTTEETVTWLAVGNVEGSLLRADPRAAPHMESILQRGGVVGYRLPPLHTSALPLFSGDTIILATDGIKAGFERDIRLEAPPQDNADLICARFAKTNDDALVIVARYVRA
jgi:hypothetical protein